MQSEKLTCSKKLQELLSGLYGQQSLEITVHTTKESACSTPQIKGVEFRHGDKFIVIQADYGLTILVPPTPKMVKKVRVTGELAGVPITQVFEKDAYEIGQFKASLTDPKTEEFEEPEA